MTGRRDFLKGTLWMGAVAVAGAAKCDLSLLGGAMASYAAPQLKQVRVGVVGLGRRGQGAVHRISQIPGVVITALCDVREEMVVWQRNYLKKAGKPAAKEFVGKEGWKALCQRDGVDVIYNATDWASHAMISLEAMRSGKHALTEVPAAMTLDECWELVETSEKTKRHCMQLENCCYGEIEMLAFNICHQGLLGDLTHGECAYIHDLRWNNMNDYFGHWRLKWNIKHKGNQYPTHGLAPICQYMNVYDLATTCSICELSERSVRNRSCPVDVPDFTRGAWKTTPPLELVDVDLKKMGLDSSGVQKDESALNV